jgi:hypothetical protein
MQGTMCEDGDLGDFLCMARHNQIISVEIEVVSLRPSGMLEAFLLTLCVLQGTDLQQLPLAFGQVHKFISNSRLLTGRSLVKFIGISQTGLTTDMVRQIAQAIASLPANTVTGPSPRLEMQKVARAPSLCFFSPLQH